MRKLYLGEAKEITIDKETEIELGLRKNKIEEVIETLTKIPRNMKGMTYKIHEAKTACDMAIEALKFQQELVRCGDCIFRYEDDVLDGKFCGLTATFNVHIIAEDNDFCSDGERRDEK